MKPSALFGKKSLPNVVVSVLLMKMLDSPVQLVKAPASMVASVAGIVSSPVSFEQA